MKTLTALLFFLAATLSAQTSKTPINNGLLQSNLDAAGYKILNANLVDYAGTGITWNTSTKKFDASGGGGGTVSDSALGSGWSGATTVAPSQNAVYNHIHAFDTNDNGKVNVLDQVAGIANTNSSGVIQTPITAPSGAIVGTTDTQTLTGKRITPRITSLSGSVTNPTINSDSCDAVTITGLSTAITSMTTNLSGTPTNFQKLIIRFTDNGTARAIAWGSGYVSSQSTLPATTVASKVTTVGLQYDSVKAKWVCLATDQEP